MPGLLHVSDHSNVTGGNTHEHPAQPRMGQTELEQYSREVLIPQTLAPHRKKSLRTLELTRYGKLLREIILWI